MQVLGHILGFPRIGLYRELKYALEQYWNGTITQNKLLDIGHMLRIRHWKQQINSGINFISVGDFSWYDHVLNMSIMINNIPNRHRQIMNKKNMLDIFFNIARGYIENNSIIPASEMKKWFNTNYHYIVPEFTQQNQFKLNENQLFNDINEALFLNYPIKPVLLGPLTYLWIGKEKETKFNKLSLLPSLILIYQEILDKLSKKNITWVQIDEPALVLDLPDLWIESYIKTYQELHSHKIKILLTTYFSGINHQLNTIKQLLIDGLHLDLISNSNNIYLFHEQLPKHWILSAGIINGRNIWKTDLYDYFYKLLPIINKKREIWIGSSCSLLHVPIDLNIETKLNYNIKTRLAFALQKCSEIKMLCDAFNTYNHKNPTQPYILKKYSILNNEHYNPKNNNVIQKNKNKQYYTHIDNDTIKHSRKTPHTMRLSLQNKLLKLPLYPTTTIGSFPQTQDIRKLRLNFKNKQIDKNQYYIGIKTYIKKIINEQEKLNLDVLVHGEPERNDMVEYFGENLNGFSFTECGWIQSYGSRCVKPPIITGNIDRPNPITIEWITYAQSLTKKPVKGILTGPITIMTWSFIREDISRADIALQLALAIRDEVMDLERSGINIIQIDEPALREGLPLNSSEQKKYLTWAINTFKITVESVKDSTQIHTHMCYSEFNEIIHDLLKLDADVISIEASRSDLKLLKFIKNIINNLNQIGPGVYDIHSAHIPSVNNIYNNINKFLKYIPKDRLWINPDCGLKTRSWSEVKESLKNMVKAATILRNNTN